MQRLTLSKKSAKQFICKVDKLQAIEKVTKLHRKIAYIILSTVK